MGRGIGGAGGATLDGAGTKTQVAGAVGGLWAWLRLAGDEVVGAEGVVMGMGGACGPGGATGPVPAPLSGQIPSSLWHRGFWGLKTLGLAGSPC